jgi:SPP1 gp7 family putative phage head morphogenesis protein
MDRAHRWTDEEIAKLERRISREYGTAVREMRTKLEEHLAKYEEGLAERTAKLDGTPEAKKALEAWKRDRAMDRRYLEGMVESLSRDATEATQRAMALVEDRLPSIYAENANWAAFEVDRAARLDTRFNLQDESTVRELMGRGERLFEPPRPNAAKVRAWTEQKLAAAVTQGILQGESIPHIAQRMAEVYGSDRAAAVRAARTACTGAENAGRVSSYERAERLGIEMRQEWMATLDERTRDTHRLLDGERVEVGGTFTTANGDELRFPGDPQGPPEEVYNCRCTLVAAVDGVDQSAAARFDRLPDNMTYEEWREQARRRMEGEQVGEPPVARGYMAPDIGTAPVRPRASDFDDADELAAARSAYRENRDAFESRRQALVDEIASQPGHGYGTREEVLAWADRRGVTMTEEVLSAVDSRTMDEIVDVSERLMKKYPEVLQSFESVGGRYVIGLSDDPSVFMEAWGGLKLNLSYFPDYRSAVDHVVDGYTHASYSEQVGRNLAEMVRGDGTFRTSVTHEFGHNLDSTIRYGLDIEGVSAYRSDLMDLTRRYTTSEYAMVNDLEAFAEGFAEMECNPTSDYARAFADFLRRWR